MADKKKAKKGEEGEEKKGMGAKLKPLLMIVAAGAAYKFVLAPKPATTAASTVIVEAEKKIEEGSVVTIPELVLNLKKGESDEKAHYLRVGAGVVLAKGVNGELFTEEELPKASDILVEILSEKTMAELEEEGAKAAVKDELKAKAQEEFGEDKVVRILFTSFVMQ